jgi:carbon storage regulator CsrA
MLVLTRRIEQVIRVRDDIKLTVVKIKGGKVCLGIEAPNWPVEMDGRKRKERKVQ